MDVHSAATDGVHDFHGIAFGEAMAGVLGARDDAPVHLDGDTPLGVAGMLKQSRHGTGFGAFVRSAVEDQFHAAILGRVVAWAHGETGMETLFAVTLTGRVRTGTDTDAVWARAAGLMRKTPEAFLRDVRQRMPLSLKAVVRAQAERQSEALRDAGLEVAVLPETGERVWLHHDGRVCGPLSATWLEQALEEGVIGTGAKVRSLAAGAAWTPVYDWRAGKDLDLALDDGSDSHIAAFPPDVEAQQAMASPSEEVPDAAPVRSGVETVPERGAGSMSGDGDHAGSFGAHPAAAYGAGGVLPAHLQRPDLYGGFWMRFAAWLLDWMITVVGLALVKVPLAVLLLGRAHVQIVDSGRPLFELFSTQLGITLLVTWLYGASFIGSRLQATPGMLMLGLRVTTLEGDAIGFGQATARYFASWLSTLIFDFGYFMIGWTQRKQGLHDMLVSTLVVRRDGLARLHEDLASGRAMDAGAGEFRGLSTGAIIGIVCAVLLAVAVPVVGILAAIAIPAYQTYVGLSQVHAGLEQAGNVEAAVAAFYERTGRFPASNASAGVAEAGSILGPYVSGVEVHEGGEVVVRFGNQAIRAVTGRSMALMPTVDGGAIQWFCEPVDMPHDYVPASCRR